MSEVSDYSSAVTEIMTKPPGIILRLGNTAIFSILALILGGTTLISYNDIIQGKVILTTLHPPVYFEAKVSGKLSEILVSADDEVTEGEVLAIIESTADANDVVKLQNALDNLNINDFKTFDSFVEVFASNLVLGPIQEDYNNFIIRFQDYQNHIINKPNLKEITALNEQLAENKLLLKHQLDQLKLLENELSLEETEYKRNRKLRDGGVISDKEYEMAYKNFLSAQQKRQNLRIAIASTNIQLSALQSEKAKLEITDLTVTSNYRERFNESVQRLKNGIISWERSYLIRASINGTVSFFGVWNKNQNVKAGEVLFTVVPQRADVIIGKMAMPIQNSGKVKVGQNVIIKLENYPPEEWGNLTGKILKIGAVPNQGEDSYAVYISVDSLITSSNKRPEFRQEMHGTAEIITEELSVFSRIFYQIKRTLQRR